MYSLRLSPSFSTVRRFCALLALALFVLPIGACGGEDSPAQVTGPDNTPQLQVDGGTFDVTTRIIFDTCESTTAHDASYDIQIDDGDFTMGSDWIGTWDPKTVTGRCESEHIRNTYRYCTVTTWTEANISFSTKDEFSGTIMFRRRVSGDCNTPCVTTWEITGVRQDPAP